MSQSAAILLITVSRCCCSTSSEGRSNTERALRCMQYQTCSIRKENSMQAAFTILISLQFLIILLHDLVEIPGWSHTSQIQAVLGKHKLWAATLANSVFPGIAAAFA